MIAHARFCPLLLGSIASACVASWPLPEICPEAGCSTGEPGSASTGISSMSEPTGDGIQTVTGDTATGPGPGHETGTPPAEPPVDPWPPTKVAFAFEPPELTEPGTASVALTEVSGDFVNLLLYRGAQVVASGPPESFAYTFEATSEDLNGEYEFELVAIDGKTANAEALAILKVELPAHGFMRCRYQDKDGSLSSGITGLIFVDEIITAIGYRDEGSGPRLAVWKIDKSCAAVPGWPRTIDAWTALDVGNLISQGAAIAAGEEGHIVITGNLFDNNNGPETRPYLALLKPDGTLNWETTGELDDLAAGVAWVPWPYEKIVMVGSRLTDKNLLRYDGLVQGYGLNGAKWIDVLKAPFTADEIDQDVFSEFSEKVLAATVNPETLEVLVVGEREFRPTVDPAAFTRTFTARYYPDGGRIGSWTSSGDYLPHDSARSLKRCGDEFVTGGWARDKLPGSPTYPLVRRLDSEGKSVARRSEPFTETRTSDVDCEREGKLVSASTREIGNQTDVLIHAFLAADEPPVWQAQYDGPDMVDDGAAALACNAWGFCAWGGHERAGGKPRALVQIHYP